MKKNTKINLKQIIIFILLIITILILFSRNFKSVQITAHRGCSIMCPENTMSAFKEAVSEEVDYIELDVSQTLDKVIVVMHDENLLRTTGLDKNIWEVTYEEIKDLDNGSWFGKEFYNEKISTLEEVIQFAKQNNIKLNIELKKTGHEEDFEKQVINLINKYRFSKKCLLTSKNYEDLEEIKKYDKNITTVYIMNISFANIDNLEYADEFSIVSSSITKEMVSQIHNVGKKIHAWTVNEEYNIINMIELNVDDIITDNPMFVKNIMLEEKNDNVITRCLKYLFR